MLIYILSIRPEAVVRLLKAELTATDRQPELYYSAWEDYLIEEDFDRRRLGVTDSVDYHLVSVDAVLNIEPRLEQNYWTLKVIAHRDVGPQKINDAAALIGAKLTLEQFAALLADRANSVTVRLDVATPFALEHFNTWLTELRARHPDEEGVVDRGGVGMAQSSGTSEKGWSLFREGALWEKDLRDKIIAWNVRSSAKAEQHVDRLTHLVGSMLTRILGRK